MLRLILLPLVLFACFDCALADDGADVMQGLAPSLTHWLITMLGVVVAARLAGNAFGRAVTVGDISMFPRYMTSRQQYRLGLCTYVLFSCVFFLLLIHENREIFALAPSGVIPDVILEAAKNQSASYLAVVAAMGAVYLYLLTKETDWNVLLMMRGLIYSWISVPQLAKQIIAEIRVSLRIPEAVLPDVIARSPALTEHDFRKDSGTPDRIWAEICYMRWWLKQGRLAGNDGTFFTEESFGFDKLMDDFQQASLTMTVWKSGAATDLDATKFAQIVRQLHDRFSRLVACYLIYRNASRKDLCAEADAFGVELPANGLENPLRYWIVYIMALIFSVYIGVLVSAVAYDAINGKGLVLAQDPGRLEAWVMYSLCNYGLAIVVVLLLRLAMSSLGNGFGPSHLITYCWSFLVSFIVGPIGLSVAVHFFGQGALKSVPPLDLYYGLLMWGLGPALVAVFISYYLDRQTSADLPDIDTSAVTIGWRLSKCLGFATGAVVLLLPSLLSLTAPEGAIWETSKLRFVATGTTFCVTFGLALAAQFVLGKTIPAQEAVVSRI